MNTNPIIKSYKETTDFLKTKAVKLADHTVISYEVGPIQLIIGSDNYGKFVGETLGKNMAFKC